MLTGSNAGGDNTKTMDRCS